MILVIMNRYLVFKAFKITINIKIFSYFVNFMQKSIDLFHIKVYHIYILYIYGIYTIYYTTHRTQNTQHIMHSVTL